MGAERGVCVAEWSMMHPGMLAIGDIMLAWAETVWTLAKVIIGFSFIIFVHELGHFLAAKWVGIRVDRFSVGFGPRLFGWRSGEGLTFGERPNYAADDLAEKRFGETDYCFRALPLGGYVKMLGEEDIIVDEKTGEMKLGNDPRAFPSRPVGQRLIVASAGVIFNLLFAAILLMCVFLVGRPVIAPVVGMLEADSPGVRAGLQRGDRIVAINGNPISSFNEIRIAEILADSELRLRVERNGEKMENEFVVPLDGDDRLRTIGVAPAETTTLAGEMLASVVKPRAPAAGDVITHVNGEAVQFGWEIRRAFTLSDGRAVKLTIQPADGDAPFECEVKPAIGIAPDSVPPNTKLEDAVSYRHILGLLPRRAVIFVNNGSPAERAGLRAGDAIAEWGPIANPRYSEIVSTIQEYAGRKLRVAVERNGERVELEIIPKRPFQFFGTADAKVGAGMVMADSGRPVVADTLPGTPAAAMRLPRGALLVAIDEQPVYDWFDVIRLLKTGAGRTVQVRYRAGDQEAVASMAVPSSPVNELGLPPTASVISVDNERSLRRENGGEDKLPSPEVLRRMLAARVGQTVTLRYQVDPYSNEVRTAEFAVRPDNIDPWQMRIEFGSPVPLEPRFETLSANGNPVKAMRMGFQVTYDVVINVLYTMRQSTKRGSAVTENVAGPVGIVGVAMGVARTSFSDLLFFLAFLSANLAVFNLLPVPVLDGGLIMFLLIEKIKGKPLSLKTQMISTIVGLAVILLVFIVVTIQDVARLL